MFKLLVLLSIVAVACASNVDKILGSAEPMAVAYGQGEETQHCGTYALTKTDTTCTCKDKTGLPVAELSNSLDNVVVNIVIIEVASDAEAAASQITSEDCSCQGKKVEVGVYRVINDNYYLSYIPLNGDVNNKLAVLNRKTIDSKASFDAMLELVGFNKKGYTLLCNGFTA